MKRSACFSSLLLCGAAFLFLVSCADGEEYGVRAREESKTTGTISLYFYQEPEADAPVDSVEVVELASKKKVYSKNGLAKFSDLPVGAHRFSVKRDGYVPFYADIDLTLDGTTPNVPIVSDLAKQYGLFRAGGVLVGKAYHGDAPVDTVFSPFAGAKVVVENLGLGCAPCEPLEPWRDTAVVDSDGVYAFMGLPATAVVTLRLAPHDDGELRYDGDTAFAEVPREGDTSWVEDLLAKLQAAKLRLISTNALAIEDTTALKLTFDRTVTEYVHITQSILVTRKGGVGPVGVEISWSKDRKTLSIAPSSGRWTSMAEYKVEYDLWDAAGGRDAELTFVPVGTALKAPTGLALDSAYLGGTSKWNKKCVERDADELYFSWKKVDGANSYRVFLADEEDVDFNFETEVADPEFAILGPLMFAIRDQLWLQVMACDEKGNCGPFAKERLTIKACD